MFDVTECLDQLRRRETGWLRARRVELVREQRRLAGGGARGDAGVGRAGAIDEGVAARDGVSERTVRETVETARASGVVACGRGGGTRGRVERGAVGVGRAAGRRVERRASGRAGRRTSRRWIWRGWCARSGRRRWTKPGPGVRREGLRMWWQPDRGMLAFRGELPDLDGARFENTINRMIDRMRPAKGEAWDSRSIAVPTRSSSSPNGSQTSNHPQLRARPLLVVHVPQRRPRRSRGDPVARRDGRSPPRQRHDRTGPRRRPRRARQCRCPRARVVTEDRPRGPVT